MLDLGELLLHLDVDDSRLNRGLDGVENRTGAFRSKLGTFAKYGAAAFVGIGASAAVFGLRTAAANEQARISFGTMLGSAKKAGAFLDDLSAFAARTPFEFPELQRAASSLISAGIEANKVIPIMTTLGDVTSGMGTGSEGVQRATVALQQMAAAGKITGEDLAQLRDAGIPVYDLLAKATGKSKEEVVALADAGKLGKKELGQMMDALESGKGLERFNGMMEKQSKSLSGLWSSLQDTMAQGAAKAIEPLIPWLKMAMSWILTSGVPALGALGDKLSGLGVFVQRVIDWFASLGGSGDKTSGRMRQLGSDFSSIWGSIKQIFTDGVAIVTSLWSAFGGTITSFTRGWLSSTIAVLRGAFNVIAGIFKVVSALLRGDWAGVWAGIKQILSGAVGIIVGSINGLWNIARSIFRAGGVALKAIFSGIWSGIKSLASAGGTAVVNMIRGIPGKLKALAGSFGSAGKALINAFVNGMKNAGGIISGIAGNVWTAVKKLLNGAIGKLRSALNFSISIPGPDIHVNVGSKIPYLAEGGYADKATLGVFGEAGPEVVLPLNSGKAKAAMAHLAGSEMGPAELQPPIQVTQNITTHESQDNEQIGNAASARLMFKLGSLGVSVS